jgi:hypothetical protein
MKAAASEPMSQFEGKYPYLQTEGCQFIYLNQNDLFYYYYIRMSLCMPFRMLSALSLHYLCIFSASFSLQKLLAGMFPSLFILSLYQTTTQMVVL